MEIENWQSAISLAEAVGWTVTIIAVTGVILNNHRRRACFAVWMVSNLLSAGLHIHAGMTALAVRDAIFFVLAIHGLICWSKKTEFTTEDAETAEVKK